MPTRGAVLEHEVDSSAPRRGGAARGLINEKTRPVRSPAGPVPAPSVGCEQPRLMAAQPGRYAGRWGRPAVVWAVDADPPNAGHGRPALFITRVIAGE